MTTDDTQRGGEDVRSSNGEDRASRSAPQGGDGRGGASAPHQGAEEGSAPSDKVSELTPSGILIEYQWEPKRQYRLQRPEGPQPVTNWIEVPSVTQVLDVLDKPALPWWGMKVGVGGMITLANMGLALHVGQTVGELVELLTKHQLTVNHVRDKAGDRGLAVHQALEVWAETGKLPDPSMYPPEQQGYVMGLRVFLKDVFTAEPRDHETMVGSLDYGYAGRYDLRFFTREEHSVVYHRTPKRGAKYAKLMPGTFLLDLKTSSDVYLSHYRQLEAYEQASIECGYGATDARGILIVTAEGYYRFVKSIATFDDFLAVLGVWGSEQRLKRKKREGK